MWLQWKIKKKRNDIAEWRRREQNRIIKKWNTEEGKHMKRGSHGLLALCLVVQDRQVWWPLLISSRRSSVTVRQRISRVLLNAWKESDNDSKNGELKGRDSWSPSLCRRPADDCFWLRTGDRQGFGWWGDRIGRGPIPPTHTHLNLRRRKYPSIEER